MRITLLLLCLPCHALSATLLHNEGIATLPDGRVAYREMHWQRGATEGASEKTPRPAADARSSG